MGSEARRNLPYGSAWRSAARAANSIRAPLSLPLKKYSKTLLTSSITIAWLAKTGGVYTTIKAQENVPFMLIVHIFAELSQRFLILYTGLTRKDSTKKLAVVVQTLLKLCTEQIHKSWKSSTMLYGAAVLNDGSCKKS
ncbi:hypothetical protein AAHA92_25499 [Salvia divinorum]|uniref:Uncharacterized protein n=1 Tax=Salvia divinorum TaxID=28513 RepID=A0ABD1GAX1_SALDI